MKTMKGNSEMIALVSAFKRINFSEVVKGNSVKGARQLHRGTEQARWQ
jgi:hypothetical protein